jgi:hypothetical protein
MNGAVQRCDSRARLSVRQAASRHIRTVTRARIRGKEGNFMKPFGTISTTALFLLLGLAVPAHARQEKQDENTKPPKQEQPAEPEKQQQAKPDKQEQAKPEKQAQAKPQEQQKQEQAKAPKQEQQATPEKQAQAKPQQQQQQQAKSDKQQQQTASSHGGPQRTQQAMTAQRAQPQLRLSARGSGRIPEEHFRSNFGREHSFRMGDPVMVGGYSRFQYGGFWFGFVDPWPVDWYYTDDFYIDYVDGGYYMYNPYYPGARFAITVVI